MIIGGKCLSRVKELIFEEESGRLKGVRGLMFDEESRLDSSNTSPLDSRKKEKKIGLSGSRKIKENLLGSFRGELILSVAQENQLGSCDGDLIRSDAQGNQLGSLRKDR